MASTSEINRFYNINTTFDTKAFSNALTTNHIGRCFTFFKQTESTMAIAKSIGAQGAPTGTVVLADSQTQGKGRQGRKWSSDPGNIYVSFLLRPLAAKELNKLNFVCCIAVAQAAKEHGIDAKVKWPNDVWVNDKKLAGMLIDTQFMGKNIEAVLGIGVNVNQDMTKVSDPEVSKVATSVFNEIGKQASREAFLAAMCNSMETMLGKEMAEIMKVYKSLDLLEGKQINVMPKGRDGDVKKPAKPVGYSDDGCLMVEYADGTTDTLMVGDVSIRPQ